MCKVCDKVLQLQAKANGLHTMSEIPPEIFNLNALDLRLICIKLPFMKIVALSSGKPTYIAAVMLTNALYYDLHKGFSLYSMTVTTSLAIFQCAAFT